MLDALRGKLKMLLFVLAARERRYRPAQGVHGRDDW
jgi:hypothetical protein